jgi:hypothetical protein
MSDDLKAALAIAAIAALGGVIVMLGNVGWWYWGVCW